MVCVSSHEHMIGIVGDVIARRKEHTSYTLYRSPPNFGVLDFLDSEGRMYNATLNVAHTIAVRPLRELVRVSGGRKLKLYWCVPDTSKFQNYAERPISDAHLAQSVRQHVLWMPRTPAFRCSQDGNSLPRLAVPRNTKAQS